MGDSYEPGKWRVVTASIVSKTENWFCFIYIFFLRNSEHKRILSKTKSQDLSGINAFANSWQRLCSRQERPARSSRKSSSCPVITRTSKVRRRRLCKKTAGAGFLRRLTTLYLHLTRSTQDSSTAVCLPSPLHITYRQAILCPFTNRIDSELHLLWSSSNKHILVETALRDSLMPESKHTFFRTTNANPWSIFSPNINILWTTEAFGNAVQAHSVPWILHTECLRISCFGTTWKFYFQHLKSHQGHMELESAFC